MKLEPEPMKIEKKVILDTEFKYAAYDLKKLGICLVESEFTYLANL